MGNVAKDYTVGEKGGASEEKIRSKAKEGTGGKQKKKE